MGRGKILERGTHQELLAQQGIYKKIYDLQLECETETEVNQGEAE
jgi:ATP-binding cassette subfamily B protein